MTAERDLDLGRHHDSVDTVIALEIVILILVVVINTFVIAIFASHRRLRVGSNLHVVLVCVTDLMVGVVLMPLHLSMQMNILELSHSLCRFVEFLKYFTLTSSVYCVVLIAIERLRIVMATQALKGTNFRWQAARAATIFVLGALYGGCVAMQYSKVDVSLNQEESNSSEHSPSGVYCGVTGHGVHVAIVSADFVLLSGLPVLLTSLLYLLMVRQSRRHASSSQSQHVVSAARRRHVHLVQLSVTLVSLYAVCQVPMRVWSLVAVFHPELVSGSGTVTDTLALLSFCNSWLSALAYAAFHRDFVQAVRRLVPCCLLRVHPHPGHKGNAWTTNSAAFESRPVPEKAP